jgi:predicted DNA-binding transcriptional regulator AlpA
MRAPTAAAYVGERSVASFRRSVGKLWPRPLKLAGKGERWLKEDLDAAIDRASKRASNVRDAADVL